MEALLAFALLASLSVDGGALSAPPPQPDATDASGPTGRLPLPDGGPSGADAVAPSADDAGGGQPAPADGGVVSPQAARPAAKVVFAGRVMIRGTRDPLVGALVHVGVGDGTEATAESASDGSFTVEVLPGQHAMRVHSPGYVPIARHVTVPPDTADFVVRLERRTLGERYETVVMAEPDKEPAVPLGREDLVRTAGSLGDPFRVIESLPGVAQSTWPLPFYAIRGANPGNTGFFIDGVRAPALFHFALGPSVIHPFFIQGMEFFPGGYPVAYGRYASGIVAARTATPSADKLHVSADMRLYDVGGIVASPFNDGKGTIAVAGRYSYTGYILSAFSNAYSVDYWDYQIRAEHPLGPGKLQLFAFGSGDNLEQKNPDKTDWGFIGQPAAMAPGLAKLTFHRAQLRWDGSFAGGRLSAAAVAGFDDSTVSITSLFSLPVGSRMYTLAPRLAERWALSRWLDLEVGVDAELQWIRPDSLVARAGGFLGENYQTDLFQNRLATSGGAYAGTTLRLGDRLLVTPAFRYDAYYEQGTSEYAPSPRLTVRLQIGAHDWIKATAGQFSQLPSLPVGVPGFESFGLADYGLQRSRQASLGIESAFSDRLGIDVSLDASLFYQRLHLSDLKNSLIPDPEAQDLLEPRDGESYGVEVMIRRPMRHKVYGWLAYTLSKSVRRISGIVVSSDWDQRHILNLVVGYRLPRNYSTSVRFHYNTGRPYPLYSERASDVEGYIRLPSFPQLDVRADRRFVFDTFVLDAYVEVVNATLSREVFDVKRNNSGAIYENAYRLVLPSAGVHVEW